MDYFWWRSISFPNSLKAYYITGTNNVYLKTDFVPFGKVKNTLGTRFYKSSLNKAIVIVGTARLSKQMITYFLVHRRK